MKKLKKLLAGAFALVLAVALLPIQPAMTVQASTVLKTSATIDTGLKGSLTVYKYEYNGASGSEGTGEATDSVPSDANLLAGAGFTIYKVNDINLLNYYSTNPATLPAVTDYFTDGDFDKGIDTTKVTKVGNELTTGTDGKVTFSNLELGFYIVVETTVPDAVTSEMNPFIVSIPMTTVDGDNWLYDVTVFPKNKTSYGGVTLEKVDAADSNIKLEGVEFKLEKFIGDDEDDDADWIEITKAAGAGGDNTGADLTLTTGSDGKITVAGLTQGTYRFTEVSLGNTSDDTGNGGYILDAYTHYVFVVNADKTISYDKNGDGDKEDSGENDANMVITVTNDKPDFEKEVKDRTDTSADTQWGIDSDYNVGDTIPYRLTIEVPTKITMLDLFTVTDTPTNLRDDTTSIKLTYGGTKAAAFAENALEVSKDAYTVAATTDGNGFVITFVPSKMANYAGKYIGISYNATLLDTAVVTTKGNPNTAKLEYNNKIDSDGNGQGTDKIEDNATIYTFEIDIVKKAQSATGTALADVEFDLYKEVESSTTGAITGDDAKAVGLDSSKYWLKINTSSLKTDSNGKVSQSRLANGTYYLVETKTKAGYNLLKEPVEVKLEVEYRTSYSEATEWTVDASGNASIVKTTINWSQTTFTGTDDSDTTNDATDGKDGSEEVVVINKEGFTLPTTGGMGTGIFVFVGVSMMAAAVILFVTTKKKEAGKAAK